MTFRYIIPRNLDYSTYYRRLYSINKYKNDAKAAKAADTYVIAAHQSASFAPANSCGIVVFVVSNHFKARFDASNSTGKVTKLNNAVIPKMTSVASNMILPMPLPMPIANRLPIKINCCILDEKFTIGTIAERNVNGA